MQSYADRYTHDFFFERDYPDVAVLDRIYTRLSSAAVEKLTLQKQLGIDLELFDKAIEKLWIHAGAVLDSEENVTRGEEGWRPLYIAQAKQKAAQIEAMIRYAANPQCRMATLVRHFGDLADRRSSCGICDFCAPAQCVAQRFRTATIAERATLFRVLSVLRRSGPKSTGKLHTEVCPNGEMTRDEFEEVLGAMARAGLVQHVDAVFEKDGKQIPYRNVKLTREGDRADENTPIRFIMKDVAPASPKQTRRKKARSASEQTATRARPRQKQSIAAKDRTPAMEVRSSQLEEALRSWRLAEARRRGIPAFRVFTDRALRAMVDRRPATAEELLTIPGIGMATVKQYGPHIYRILRGTGL